MTVSALQAVYEKLKPMSSRRADSVSSCGFLQGFGPKFSRQAAQAELDRQLGADTTLDSAKIRTGLMIMTKRLDTGSPWPLNNGGGENTPPGRRWASRK